MYYIEDLTPENEYVWDDFNNNSLCGSFFHTIKWKNIIVNSFGEKNHNFIIYYNDEVIGINPFYQSRIKYFKGLVSLPHSDYRNILIDEQHINKILIKKIYDKCKLISKINNLSFFLINSLNKKIFTSLNEYNPSPYPINGVMNLNLEVYPPDKIWNNIFSAKNRQRNYIRRFQNDGFEIKRVENYEDMKLFYFHYKKNLEYVNAIPYDFSHFNYLWNNLTKKELIITLLKREKEIAGGILSFYYKPHKTLYLRYLALNRSLNHPYSPLYYLVWDLIVRYYELGCNKICLVSTTYNKKNIHYRIKQKFGSIYEKSYNSIFNLSILFKISYNIYRLLNYNKNYTFFELENKFLKKGE
jgi:hypothetical protein